MIRTWCYSMISLQTKFGTETTNDGMRIQQDY